MTAALPKRLTAGDPGWATRADVVAVGSGSAGLTVALRLRDQVEKVIVVTKDVPSADFISGDALTHSAVVFDLGMDLRES